MKNNMRTVINRLVLTVLLAGLMSVNVFAVKDGTIIVSDYEPRYVQAGDRVMFNITVINTGNEAWLKKEYEHKIVIYDLNMKQVEESGRKFGEKDIPPSRMEILLNDFIVPGDWEGQYYYRPAMKLDDRTIEGDRYSFWVEKKVEEEKKPLFSVTGGNLTLGFQSSSKYSNLADFNIDFGGDSGKNRYDLNTSGRYRDASGVTNNAELQNILFNYNIKKTKLSLGDVNPSFSEYTLNYRTSRGGLCAVDMGNMGFSLVATNTREKQEGIYAQYMAGGKFKYNIRPDMSASFNYVNIYDDKNSLSAPGAAAPVTNDVVSLTLNTKIKKASVELEAASSRYDADSTDTSGPKTDTALSVKSGYSYKDATIGVRISRISPEFYSLANESLTNDRMNYGISLNQKYKEILNFSVNTDFSNDNLNNLDTMPTSNIQNLSINGNTTLTGIPRISLNLSNQSKNSNEVLGYKTDDTTLSGALGLSHVISIVNVSLNDRIVQFRDSTGKTNDSDSNTLSMNLSLPIKETMSLSSGMTMNSTQDLITTITRNNNTINITFNCTVNKINTSVNLNSSLSNTSDKLSDNKTNGIDVSASYRINGMSINGGINVSIYEDMINSSNNYDDSTLKLSMTYSF